MGLTLTPYTNTNTLKQFRCLGKLLLICTFTIGLHFIFLFCQHVSVPSHQIIYTVRSAYQCFEVKICLALVDENRCLRNVGR